MTKPNLQVSCFLFALAVPLTALSQSAEVAPPEVQKCIEDLNFSDISYEDLRARLTVTLNEKNKSLIFMDFRGLQAQIDVMVTHLMAVDSYSKEDTKELLLKISAHLDMFQTLLIKAKVNAKIIKEEFVVPLATQTSLKAEYDRCKGIDSQFTEIFRLVSQLNKDLNEILMLSPAKIQAQKENVENLIAKTEEKDAGMTAKNISEPLNFLQNQINTVTHTFQFDTRKIGLAKN